MNNFARFLYKLGEFFDVGAISQEKLRAECTKCGNVSIDFIVNKFLKLRSKLITIYA